MLTGTDFLRLLQLADKADAEQWRILIAAYPQARRKLRVLLHRLDVLGRFVPPPPPGSDLARHFGKLLELDTLTRPALTERIHALASRN